MLFSVLLRKNEIRNLPVDPLRLVGDLTKTSIFVHARILDGQALLVFALALPVMVFGTATGFRLNRRLGETGFAAFFWMIMAGYSIRILGSL